MVSEADYHIYASGNVYNGGLGLAYSYAAPPYQILYKPDGSGDWFRYFQSVTSGAQYKYVCKQNFGATNLEAVSIRANVRLGQYSAGSITLFARGANHEAGLSTQGSNHRVPGYSLRIAPRSGIGGSTTHTRLELHARKDYPAGSGATQWWGEFQYGYRRFHAWRLDVIPVLDNYDIVRAYYGIGPVGKEEWTLLKEVIIGATNHNYVQASEERAWAGFMATASNSDDHSAAIDNFRIIPSSL